MAIVNDNVKQRYGAFYPKSRIVNKILILDPVTQLARVWTL